MFIQDDIFMRRGKSCVCPAVGRLQESPLQTNHVIMIANANYFERSFKRLLRAGWEIPSTRAAWVWLLSQRRMVSVSR